MSDLDTLVVTFQSQLSEVLETVLKTAMYEVTRLVEGGLMEEVRRRSQEVESLQMQLQWAQRNLSDKEMARKDRCVDCGKADVKVSADMAEEMITELQHGVMRGSGLKQEDHFVDRWTRISGLEGMSNSEQETDNLSSIFSPVTESQTREEDSLRPFLEVKEEEVDQPSCSIEHEGRWAPSHDGGARSESQSPSEITDVQLKQPQWNGEDSLRAVVSQDAQNSSTQNLIEDGEDTHTQCTHVVTEPPQILTLEMESTQTGLTLQKPGQLHNQTLQTDKDCEPATTRGSPQQAGPKPMDSVTLNQAQANLQIVRSKISSLGSPQERQQNRSVGDVVIKQELVEDSDGTKKKEVEEKEMTGPGMQTSSCSMKYRLRREVLKQNISTKPTVQEVLKLHSKVGTTIALQAAIQHLQPPTKKTCLTHMTATDTTPSQRANLNTLNRTSATSKPASSPSISVQQTDNGAKHFAGLTRTCPPWVSIRTHHQTPNSTPPHPADPHPGSHFHSQLGPRQLLRCGQCGKCFPHPSNLKAHLQIHTGERPFCCSLCGRSFTKLSNLKAHRRVHTGERPYCCLACGKRFTQKCNLKRHQRIHLDV
ncbi:zinc finger and SCAN domain-containing protein 21 isoform X1 [Lampris incognitus]|uniref:zinc finger and SCAN domain-containing protein 21 isoform X1 n=1 Tax=Lampris incognitus TaxID=2546036 RepID=UPI0024B61A5C|nr:zinc finger and SCAN domain-containing protein 21 isoform X1 [Lampris incognitus]